MNPEEDGAPSPSPSTRAHQASTADANDVTVEFERFKEKTRQWKQAVKSQLEEAAAKNSTLREELKRRHADHEKELAQLRLELNSEFTERTLFKDQQITRQQDEMERLRAQHASELRSVENRLLAKMESALTELRDEHNEVLRTLATQQAAASEAAAEEAARRDRMLENTKHELAVSQAKCQQIRSQSEELQRQLAAKADASAAAEAQGNTLLEREVESLRQQLELQSSKVLSLQDHMDKLATAHRDDLQRRDEIREDEVQKREERILVLQSILKQSQQESQDLHFRWNEVVAAHQRDLDAVLRERDSLSQDLRESKLKLEALQHKFAAIDDECIRSKRQIQELEATNVIRDRTFQELLMNEDHKNLLSMIQQRLNTTTDELHEWQSKYLQLSASLDERRSEIEREAAALHEREAAVDVKLQSLQEKQSWFTAQENRLREQQAMLSKAAAQAVHMWQPQSSRGDLGSPGDAQSRAINVNDDVIGQRSSDSQLLLGGITTRWSTAVTDIVSSIQQNYVRALARSNGSRRGAASLLFRHYKRFLPVVVVLLMAVTLVYWWLFSGVSPSSTNGSRSLSAMSDLDMELKTLKREYGLLAVKYSQCCPNAPPVAQITPEFALRLAK